MGAEGTPVQSDATVEWVVAFEKRTVEWVISAHGGM